MHGTEGLNIDFQRQQSTVNPIIGNPIIGNLKNKRQSTVGATGISRF